MPEPFGGAQAIAHLHTLLGAPTPNTRVNVAPSERGLTSDYDARRPTDDPLRKPRLLAVLPQHPHRIQDEGADEQRGHECNQCPKERLISDVALRIIVGFDDA